MAEKKSFIYGAQEIIPPVNDSPYKRILAIGDVHSAFDKLSSLWNKLSVTKDDLVIFLGDYLYGLSEQNIETLHWLIKMSKQKNIIFLCGNTDVDALEIFFDENGKLFPGAGIGLDKDIKTAAIKEPYLPQEIFNFLRNLLPSYSITVGGRKYFFCHAGIKVGVPLEKQTKTYLINHPKLKSFYENYSGNAVIVVGHKRPGKIFKKLPQLFEGVEENICLTEPLKVLGKNILMLDTYAKDMEGYLSCVDILSGEFWQNDADSIDSIIFVCAGNTCRSPMAKYIMRRLLAERNLSDKVFVDSAGCETRGGSSMAKKACDVLAENHIPFDKHISKQFTIQDYRKFKCIIALDEIVLQEAKSISKGDPDNKIRLFTDFDGNELDVDDPFPTGDYRKAYEVEYIGCSALLKKIFE